MEALVLIGLLLAGIIPALYALGQYNVLTALRSRVRESWSHLDTELLRRYELIPRLVEIARDHAARESETLDRVAELRDRCAANHGSVSSQAREENELVAGLRELLARLETYPDLTIDTRFRSLHQELTPLEDHIQAARRSYNGNVRDYRKKCGSFPGSLLAQMFGFRPAGFFEVDSVLGETPAARPSIDEIDL